RGSLDSPSGGGPTLGGHPPRRNPMASIIRQFTLDAPAGTVWDAVADFGALHTRLVPGFVTATAVDGDVRTVTFGNGMVVRERLAGMDPRRGRLAHTKELDRAQHHAAARR